MIVDRQLIRVRRRNNSKIRQRCDEGAIIGRSNNATMAMRASENDCESDGEREIVRGAVREGCERWRTGVNARGRSHTAVNDHVIDETIELGRFNYGGKSL